MTDTAAPPLQVRDLRKEYPSAAGPLVVLDGATFDLDAGRTLAVMGPSGSGKSTLLQILGVLDQPTSGSVSFEGRDPFALPPREQARLRNGRIGFVFQDHHLLPQLSALENVLIPALANGPAAAGIEARATRLLGLVGLEGRLEHRPARLSGGERQRVAVARAMINSPALLLCDEPTGNLDRKSADAVAEIFLTLRAEEKTSLVVVTHSADLAERFDRRLELRDGKLVEVA